MKENEDAFTGLEAAIVLIAFVVVAATFSYVMLGAGFYTTQKSQQVVHNSIQKASSSMMLSGDVVVRGGNESGGVDKIFFYVSNTAGGEPVDMHNVLMTYTDDDEFDSIGFFGQLFNNSTYTQPQYLAMIDSGCILTGYNGDMFDVPVPVYWEYEPIVGNNNRLLEKGEKHKIIFTMRLDTKDKLGHNFVSVNEKFKLEVKPPTGAPIAIERTIPPSVNRGEFTTVY